MLYPAMEDFAIDIVIGKGASARSIRLDLPHFTLIGATTRAGLLTAPLRDRFGVVHHLEFYTDEELQTIVERSAEVLGVEIDPQGALGAGKTFPGNAASGQPASEAGARFRPGQIRREDHEGDGGFRAGSAGGGSLRSGSDRPDAFCMTMIEKFMRRPGGTGHSGGGHRRGFRYH